MYALLFDLWLAGVLVFVVLPRSVEMTLGRHG
jgi:hypothetical protein